MITTETVSDSLDLDQLIEEGVPQEVLDRIDRDLLMEQLAGKIADTINNARKRLTAIYPGRFQPMHNGHLSVLLRAFEENDEVIIALGSAFESHTTRCPFTTEERMMMIRAVLDDAGVSRDKYQIVAVPDINRAGLWPHHIKSMTPEFGRVYSSNAYVARLFEETKDYEVVMPEMLMDGDERISATHIRDLMMEGGDWESLVPSVIAEYVKKIDGVARLRAVSNS